MPFVSTAELIQTLQISVGPVILISGVGLLLLSMTNRLGRVIDRSRLLWRELKVTSAEERGPILAQLEVLAGRGKLIRLAITLASLSVLLAAVLVIVLFCAALLRLEIAPLIGALFIACMLSLIGSMAAFIRDIYDSLSALGLELEETGEGEP